MRINKQRLLAEFADLVSIDSPTFGERQMGDHLTGVLQSLGFSVSEDDAGRKLGGNCGNLHGYLEGTFGDPLLFCVHMDTVEPSRGKRAVFESDGTIHSDGTTVLGADDAAGIAAILEAVRTIRDRQLPHRPIEILFTVAEEIYCKGAGVFDYATMKSKEAYVLDIDGPVGTAAIGAPTILTYEAVLHGKSSHAGFAPEQGVHAIVAAADAISRLKLGHVDDETTVNVGRVEGGRAANVIPDRCVVRGEIRSFTHDKALRQSGIVRQVFADCAGRIHAVSEFSHAVETHAYKTAPSHPVVRRFENSARGLGLSPVLQKSFGGSDNNHLVLNGITGIVLATAMNQCHGCGEYTTVDELCRIAELTTSLMISEI